MESRAVVVDDAYRFLVWLIPVISEFPRTQRYILGDRMERTALDLLALLVRAARARGRRDLLAAADARLDELRYYGRLCHDLRFLSPKRYEHLSRQMADMGRQIGGWLRSQGDPAREAARPSV